RVEDGDDRAVVLAGDADVDRLAVAVLDRVGQEVGDDLIQPAPVPAPDDGGGRVNVQRGADARGLVGETRADLADDLGQIDDLDVQFEAPGGDARHGEQLVDEAMQAGCLRIDLFDLRDQPWGCVVGGGAPRDAGQVRDLQLQGRQRGAQLARGQREQIL